MVHELKANNIGFSRIEIASLLNSEVKVEDDVVEKLNLEDQTAFIAGAINNADKFIIDDDNGEPLSSCDQLNALVISTAVPERFSFLNNDSWSSIGAAQNVLRDQKQSEMQHTSIEKYRETN